MRVPMVLGILIAFGGCSSPGQETMSLKAEILPEIAPIALREGVCSAPNFIEGKFYLVGSQVVHHGQLYTAVRENNAGYDPLAWKWFWQIEQICLTDAHASH